MYVVVVETDNGTRIGQDADESGQVLATVPDGLPPEHINTMISRFSAQWGVPVMDNDVDTYLGPGALPMRTLDQWVNSGELRQRFGLSVLAKVECLNIWQVRDGWLATIYAPNLASCTPQRVAIPADVVVSAEDRAKYEVKK